MGKTLWWMRAVPALRVTIGVSIAAAGIVLMPFASEAGAAGSLTLSTARAAPGEWIGVRGTGLSGCDLDRVDVRLSSINGGSSGEYADLLAAEVPVDAGDGHSIALRLPMPRPVYSSDGNADPSVSDVNHIVVTCALGGETMASTPIEIDTDPEPGQPAPPADLASRHLVVEPASGLPGTAATLWTDIHCGSTNADDGARIMWAGRELAKLSVQQSGASAYRFSVPSGPLRGPQEVSVECEAQGPGVVDTGVTRTARFEIPAPELVVHTEHAVAGAPLRLSGSGFTGCGRPADGGTGELSVRQGASVLGVVRVDPDGRFDGEVRIPSELAPGTDTLTVSCPAGGYDGDFSTTLAIAAASESAATPADGGRSRASDALPSPGSLFDQPEPVVLAGATAVLALPVVGFSAELFNKTWERNRDRVRRRLRPGAARPRSQPRVPELQVLVFVLLSAAFCVAVEPGTGLNARTAALALALTAAVPIGVLVYEGTAEAYRRRITRIRALPRLLPGALVVALALAAASRLLELTPGYVYGLFLAFTSAGLRRMSPIDEGRAIAIGACSLAGLAVTAWVWRIPVTRVLDGSGGSAFGWVFAENLLTQCFVAAVIGLVFGLLPMRFMDGHALWQWNRWAWAAIYAVAVFLFALVLLDPTGTAAGATHDMWLRSMILFGAAGAASVLFWAVFRLRPTRSGSPQS